MIDQILRSLPRFKGKQRLSRWLLHSRVSANNDLTVKGKFNCEYKIPNLQENVGFEIYINGIYEQGTSDFITQQLRPNALFADIGANIGAITIPVCLHRPDVSVVCLEASTRIFQYLKLNIANNKLSKTKLVNKAIWNEANKELSFFAPTDKFGKGSLAPVFTQTPEKVLTITLDDLAAEVLPMTIDFIKIDVEGFESFAFMGGKKLLGDPNAPSILLEFVDWAENIATSENAGAAQRCLRDFGYTLYHWGEGRIQGKIEGILTTGAAMIFATKRAI